MAEPAADSGPRLGSAAATSLVFGSSAAVLVLELMSLRLIAPYLGLTLQTNTLVIGVALAAIATGAWSGGRVADLVSPARLLGPLLLVGGALVTLVLPAVRWAGELSFDRGDASAVLLVAAVVLFAPAALLSAVPPMVVKLRLASLAETGTVVGRLSGISTLGAIAGTVLTGLVFVALVPTSVILLALGGLLVLAGAVVTLRLGGARVATTGALAVALLGSATTVLVPGRCDVETAYHCASVVTDSVRPTGRILQLDTLRHSYVDLADPTYLEFDYVQAIAAAVDARWPAGRPVRALHLGGGGLTVPRWLDATRPGSASLVLEIDRGVVELDVERLGLRLDDSIAVRVQDARVGLAEQPASSRDLVVGDAFGGMAVPWHLTTRETVRDVQRVLRPGGLYAVNVIDHPPLAFARAEVATIAAVFDHVAVLADPGTLAGRGGGNLVVLGADTPLPVEALRDEVARQGMGYGVLTGADAVRAFVGDAEVLTDDDAPVDQLVTH